MYTCILSELQESIGATKMTLDAVYGDPLMKATPYHLHAVLVHQGQASGGHYWAYVHRLDNPFLTAHSTESPAPVSHDQSHDQSHDLEQLHDTTDVVLESQDGYGSSQGSDVAPQAGQTSGLSTTETSQTGQASSLGRAESIESAPESMSESQTPTNRTNQTSLASCRSEGMEVDRGGGAVGVANSEPNDAIRNVKCEGEVWLKFNDVSVSEVGWDEVLRESLGGEQSNTSAYCLIYVSEEFHQRMKQGTVHLYTYMYMYMYMHVQLDRKFGGEISLVETANL